MQLESIPRRHPGQRIVVAATGPSLTPEVAELCRAEIVIAVNDAYRLMPWAEVLYACDAGWWQYHRGCPDFAGERWTSHSVLPNNDKSKIADRFGLHVVAGAMKTGFSTKPSLLHYGRNSGFQAVNLALLMGGDPVVMIGFDMKDKVIPATADDPVVRRASHFFGDHPKEIRKRTPFSRFIEAFDEAARGLAPGTRIYNATPGSALRCFQMVDLATFLARQEAA